MIVGILFVKIVRSVTLKKIHVFVMQSRKFPHFFVIKLEYFPHFFVSNDRIGEK